MPTAVTSPHAAGLSVELRNLHKRFPGPVAVHALCGVDLRIQGGEFLAILGPSGCGKSTLLRLIAGLESPDSGEIVVGAEAPGLCTAACGTTCGAVGYVFQDAHLLPWRDALRNVMLPLDILRRPRGEARERAAEALRQVGLAEAMNRYPAQLSGGMRMRVSLARAIVTRPRLLLLDEPFAALDEITRQSLDEQLRELWRETGTTVVFVTHSIIEAAYLARRCVVMSTRPGRIVLDHTLELPAERPPQIRGEAGFAREMAVLLAALSGGGA